MFAFKLNNAFPSCGNLMVVNSLEIDEGKEILIRSCPIFHLVNRYKVIALYRDFSKLNDSKLRREIDIFRLSEG